jgi:hypothetical protein
MGFNYAAKQTLTDRLLTKFGQTVILRTRTTGTYNTTTGSSGVTTSDTNVTAAILSYDKKFIDGQNIKAEDLQAFVTPKASTAPKQGDSMVVQGTVYRILAVSIVSPAGVPVLYECQLRKD